MVNDGDIRAYRVVGRVQGVGFRWWTQKRAVELGLTGSVRNAADGSVEVVASGAPDALDQLERALAAGPAMAGVEEVRREAVLDRSRVLGFEILR